MFSEKGRIYDHNFVPKEFLYIYRQNTPTFSFGLSLSSKSTSYFNFLPNSFLYFFFFLTFYIILQSEKSISIFKNGKPSIGDMNHYCFCIFHGNEISIVSYMSGEDRAHLSQRLESSYDY